MNHRQKLVKLYAEMAKLTKPKPEQCEKCCTPCCNDYHCGQTARYATAQGVQLPTTEHPTSKFLGAEGCTVPPHLRPICSVHVCKDQQWDKGFNLQYFGLRDKLCQLECGIDSYPSDCADCHGDIPQD